MTTDTLNKVQDTETLVNDTRKAELLAKQVEHIDITSFDKSCCLRVSLTRVSVSWTLFSVSVVIVNSNASSFPRKREPSKKIKTGSPLSRGRRVCERACYSAFERLGATVAPYKVAIGSSPTISMRSTPKPLKPVRMAQP